MTKHVKLPARSLEERAVGSLKLHDRNARTHSAAQLKLLEESIRRFGFVNPVLVDERSRILAGHGRVAAARALGLETVPVVCIEGMSEAERRAYIIADNRLAELAGWDDALLKLELGAILELEPDFALEVIGFEAGKIETLLAAALDGVDEANVVPAVDENAPVISDTGEVWLLGRHRLICGDSRDPSVYRQLLGDERAQMIITDPPYNVPISGHVCGLGKVKHAEFAMASGEMSSEEFAGFLADIFRNLVSFSTDGSVHFICMDWRHMEELLSAGRRTYGSLKQLIVWNKDNGGMGSFYRSKHELIFVYKKGSAPHINNFELGQHGRYRTNVWDYSGISTPTASRNEELAMHPTVKPVKMIADAIRDCSKRNGIVLDAFSGSGTTIMAAEETGRRARVIEIEPRYVDVAIRRWQAATGSHAICEKSGVSFAEYEQLLG